MTGLTADDKSIVAVKSETTVWRSQQTTTEIVLPVIFARSWPRRFESVAWPCLVTIVFSVFLYFGVFRHESVTVATQAGARPSALVTAGILALAVGLPVILGFLFLHRVINVLANIGMDLTDGTALRIDIHGLTDHRVAEHRIDWAQVDAVQIVQRSGIDEVELVLKPGSDVRFRRLRLDYTIFNAIVRRGKGSIVGIDVKYFDSNAHTIACVVQEMVKRQAAISPKA